jgi:hypothetical protein
MTDPAREHPEPDLLPPEPAAGALSVPPPVPAKKPGFLRRLFMSRKQQQAVAMQNGYLEMVDLIRAIRSHLDRQESVQTRVLTMLEKVPDAMDRQHEVMSLFKQQLETGMENNRRLTDSMGNLNHTLASMDETQRASSRTVTDLIHRSRESEQLLREVMRRAERRMTILLAVFVLLVVGIVVYFGRGLDRRTAAPAPEAAPADVPGILAVPPPATPETPPSPAAEPAPAPAVETAAETPGEPAEADLQPPPAETASPEAPPPRKSKKKSRPPAPEPMAVETAPAAAPEAPPPAAEAPPAIGQPLLTLDQLQPDLPLPSGDSTQPVSLP